MSLTPVLFAALLLAQSPAQTQQTQPMQQQQQKQIQKQKETFWQKVLRITGISAMPSTGKGVPGDLAGGDLWMADLDGGSRLRLTRDGGYQSPVFSSDGHAVLALREGKLVRVSTSGLRDPEPLFEAPGVIRLVGSDREEPERIFVLTRTAEGLDLGLLDLAHGKVRSLRPEAPTAEYRDTVARLARREQTWQIGSRMVSLEVRPADLGSDVFYLDGAAVDVSRCNGDLCGQPALSADGRKVIFVRVPTPTTRRGA
jgi:hypothetical protein